MTKNELDLIFNCMCALAAIDGDFAPQEAKVLESFSKENNLNPSLHPMDLITMESSEIELIFNKNLNKILNSSNSNEVLFELFHHLNELAGADELFHANEEDLIKKIGSKINKDIGIGSKSINWDERQRNVLNAKSNERLCISAPPGAGKTELVASKVLHMVNELGIEPSKILLISFTNAAVQEMRRRIFENTNNTAYPFGIQLATLDSKAFKVNKNIREDFKITGSYEESLENFLEIIKGKNYEFIEDWNELEHIFIDEAQDFVEIRKEICEELINSASQNTGISIFGDQCQQIYPWATKDKPLTDEMRENLMDIALKEKHNFKEMELTGIFRSQDDFLIKILEDMRADIYLTDDDIPSPMEKFDKTNTDFIHEQLADNYLFLFRSRKEIINAAYELIAANKPFRLKTTGNKYPKYYKSWLANFVSYSNDNNFKEVTREQFFDFATHLKPRMLIGTSQEIMWSNLKTSAAINHNIISIERLISQLNGKKVNHDFLNPDFGFRGPKLSTIHASKGSQEDNVRVKDFWSDSKDNKLDKDEAKVVFVAISRAKSKVETMPVLEKETRVSKVWKALNWKVEKDANRNSENLQRNFKLLGDLTRNKDDVKYVMEVGLNNDFDPLSIVSIDIGMDEAIKTQNFLKNFYPGNHDVSLTGVRSTLADQKFNIKAKDNQNIFHLGEFNQQVLDNSRAINSKNWRYYHPPMSIKNLRIIDIGTYFYNEKDFTDAQNKNILKPFKESKVWLIPIIYSLGLFNRAKSS
jgi:hypothetical protein